MEYEVEIDKIMQLVNKDNKWVEIDITDKVQSETWDKVQEELNNHS